MYNKNTMLYMYVCYKGGVPTAAGISGDNSGF